MSALRAKLGSNRGNSKLCHLKVDDDACRNEGKALPALLNVEGENTEPMTHNSMVSPNAEKKSLTTLGQHPSQQDAKVQNEDHEPQEERRDLLQSVGGETHWMATRRGPRRSRAQG